MISSLTSLNRTLNTGSDPFSAQNAYQRPPRWLKLKIKIEISSVLYRIITIVSEKVRNLTGILEIFVIGSIFSTQPMETSGIQSAHETCAHSCPDLVHFIAPPLFGHNTHSGRFDNAQVRQSHDPGGIDVIP